MAAVKLGEALWDDLVAVAKSQQKRPEQLVERLLRDYLDRLANEELVRVSRRQARRSGNSIIDAERAIKERRKGKRR